MSDPVITSTILPPTIIESTMVSGQGPPGIQGPAGPSGGSQAIYTASEALSGHMVLALTSIGQVEYASADNIDHLLKICGISTVAVAQGVALPVQSSGVMEHNGWTWIPDQLIFLGLNGVLTQSVSIDSLFLQVIGKALSPTHMLITLQPPVAL